MKKSIYGLGIFLVFFYCHGRLPFSHIITFYIHKAPFYVPDESKFNEAVTTPGKVASKIAKAIVDRSNQGIFVTYGGYLVVSDYNGQITFPRMQQKSSFTLFITEKIMPVMMIGNTIHHWELLDIPVNAYSIERKQDPQTQLFYWQTQKTSLPTTKILPITSIVVFAKPKNILVPEGITLTNDNPQFILPSIYTLKNSNEIRPALNVLSIRQFFDPISMTDKKENNTYYATQINTQ